MNPTIVTAFFDLGRGEWSNGPSYLKRSTDHYFQCFERLLKLKNDIVVFTSNDLMHRFDHYKLVKPNLWVVGLEDWRRDIWPEFFEPIKQIQNQMITHVDQPWNPEYWCPDYVMVNMMKSYFVNYAIEFGFVTNEMVAWVDFGMARENKDVPSDLWTYDFDPKKIHFFSIKTFVPKHMNLPDIIKTNDVWIIGTYFIASKENWKKLLSFIYGNIKYLISMNLIDDDQTAMYMCYCQYPEMFEIHYIDTNDWFCLFRNFNDT